jgi:hypothetical protein
MTKKRLDVHVIGTICLLCCLAHLSFRLPAPQRPGLPLSCILPLVSVMPASGISEWLEEYDELHLDSAGLSEQAFVMAVKGYTRLLEKGLLDKDGLLTIIDFSQSSKNKRLYVLDLAGERLLFNTYVAHGRRSGGEFATSFSNRNHSNKSSLGFYVTKDTYTMEDGYALRLDGMDKGFNDKALARGIVLHGSWYVNEQFLSVHGLLGRSLGCPAVPMEDHEQIIDSIKEGSCVFMYYPDNNYLHHSTVLGQTPPRLVKEARASHLTHHTHHKAQA